MNFRDNYVNIQSQPQDSFNLCDDGENIQRKTRGSMICLDNSVDIQSQIQESFNLCDKDVKKKGNLQDSKSSNGDILKPKFSSCNDAGQELINRISRFMHKCKETVDDLDFDEISCNEAFLPTEGTDKRLPFISCKLGNLNLKPNESFGLLNTGASGTFISEVLFAKIPIGKSYICGKKKTYLTTASETRRLINVKLAKIPLTLMDSNNQTHTEMWNFTIYDLKSNDLYFGCDFILDSKFKPSMDKNHLTLNLPNPKRTQIKIPTF